MNDFNEPTLYEQLGGEIGIKKLVERFYHHMDTLPEVKTIRTMHVDLEVSKEKLFTFLSGWTGGPQLYIEKYGHPMLRKRHMPFSIGMSERDQWLVCMANAIIDCGIPEPIDRDLLNSLSRVADHMRNREE
jgi:hemoglobin